MTAKLTTPRTSPPLCGVLPGSGCRVPVTGQSPVSPEYQPFNRKVNEMLFPLVKLDDGSGLAARLELMSRLLGRASWQVGTVDSQDVFMPLDADHYIKIKEFGDGDVHVHVVDVARRSIVFHDKYLWPLSVPINQMVVNALNALSTVYGDSR